MGTEWYTLRMTYPCVGELYDLTNDNPYTAKFMNIRRSFEVKSLEVGKAVFGNGFDNIVIDKDNANDWWFRIAGVEHSVDVKDQAYKPKHHTTGAGFECIECMQMILTREQYVGFLLGNAFKYIWRHKLKGNPKQDLAKADWYLSRAVELTGGTENTGILIDKVASLMNEMKG